MVICYEMYTLIQFSKLRGRATNTAVKTGVETKTPIKPNPYKFFTLSQCQHHSSALVLAKIYKGKRLYI
ncbi:MAG: hypothetical protein OHK0047_00010 [Leptolyngbyaceae cyanobacterium]